MADSVLVLPTEIPWANLKARDLEETVYWLLDALGAKDLEWRRGGEGAGAADQGRDLEATFQVETPDGSFDAKRWWVEAKGRSRSVERRAVQNALKDAEARSEVDVLVVVTNTTFTNPVRDFVTEWNALRKRPAVKLWDRDILEKMLSRHPSVVARLFSHALSPQGQLEAVRERFWNRSAFASSETLSALWEKRLDLEFSFQSIFALIASEYANGKPELRSWSPEFDDGEVLGVFIEALANILFLMTRSAEAGGSQAVLGAIAHLLAASVKAFGAAVVEDAIDVTLHYSDGTPWPQTLRDYVLPILTTGVVHEFFWACRADCVRVDVGLRKEPSPTDYWNRFRKAVDVAGEDRRFLYFERYDKPCKVGFALDAERLCPLHKPPEGLRDVLDVIERVVRMRTAEAT